MKVAIVGLGKMGGALADALVRKGFAVTAFDPARKRLPGGRVAGSCGGAVRGADVVLLCVKPVAFREVLPEVAEATKGKAGLLVVSVAAGVGIKSVESALGENARVARAMPNLCASVGKAVTAVAFGSKARAGDRRTVARIFGAAGKVVVLRESELDAATAVSGCAPAYFYYFAQKLAQAGRKAGLPKTIAELLASEALAGSAALFESLKGAHGKRLSELIAGVATPGGATDCALKEFEKNGFGAAVERGIRAARNRARRLGRTTLRRGNKL